MRGTTDSERVLARLERTGFPLDTNLKKLIGTLRPRSKAPRMPIPLEQAHTQDEMTMLIRQIPPKAGKGGHKHDS